MNQTFRAYIQIHFSCHTYLHNTIFWQATLKFIFIQLQKKWRGPLEFQNMSLKKSFKVWGVVHKNSKDENDLSCYVVFRAQKLLLVFLSLLFFKKLIFRFLSAIFFVFTFPILPPIGKVTFVKKELFSQKILGNTFFAPWKNILKIEINYQIALLRRGHILQWLKMQLLRPLYY